MRKSGVLMHITSLPSPWGIGTLGKAARDFIDFLDESGQKYWQILPVSPTGFGDSPYQSFSAYAGNPYFIDLDMLCEWGLLKKTEYSFINWGNDPQRVDYGLIYRHRFDVLRKASERLFASDNGEFYEFCSQNSFWLDDYALFMALKDSYGGASWFEWEHKLRFRNIDALERAKSELKKEVGFYKALQYLFFLQWDMFHAYAKARNIQIIGDMPIYVAPDSADLWANPHLFMLDDELLPTAVAGCPPDSFSQDGQLWGNPLYNWEEMKNGGYAWWINRITHQFRIYDVLRIDHFRGFDEYYAIPYGSPTAADGEWRRGPGIEFFNVVKRAIGEKPIIAEDLGYLNESVRKLLADSGFPGMKVLQFAFDSFEDSDYLPHNFPRRCAAYTGTHDNDTIKGWFRTAPAENVRKARDYIRIRTDESEAKAMLSALWGSVADLAIAQMQDLLDLGNEARMNTPGTVGGNWQWRMKPYADLSGISAWLKHITRIYGRYNKNTC